MKTRLLAPETIQPMDTSDTTLLNALDGDALALDVVDRLQQTGAAGRRFRRQPPSRSTPIGCQPSLDMNPLDRPEIRSGRWAAGVSYFAPPRKRHAH